VAALRGCARRHPAAPPAGSAPRAACIRCAVLCTPALDRAVKGSCDPYSCLCVAIKCIARHFLPASLRLTQPGRCAIAPIIHLQDASVSGVGRGAVAPMSHVGLGDRALAWHQDVGHAPWRRPAARARPCRRRQRPCPACHEPLCGGGLMFTSDRYVLGLATSMVSVRRPSAVALISSRGVGPAWGCTRMSGVGRQMAPSGCQATRVN